MTPQGHADFQREDRPARASVNSYGMDSLPSLEPRGRRQLEQAQSPLVTLVDGEQSSGAGPVRWLVQAGKSDQGSPVASTSV